MVMAVNTTGERNMTKTEVDVSYLFNISMDFLLHVSTYDLGHHLGHFYNL
jgi:hypothetical protein